MAADWEHATLEVTEGISLFQGLTLGWLRHFVKGKRTWTRAFESASSALRRINCSFVRSTRGSHRWPSGRCSRRSECVDMSCTMTARIELRDENANSTAA